MIRNERKVCGISKGVLGSAAINNQERRGKNGAAPYLRNEKERGGGGLILPAEKVEKSKKRLTRGGGGLNRPDGRFSGMGFRRTR